MPARVPRPLFALAAAPLALAVASLPAQTIARGRVVDVHGAPVPAAVILLEHAFARAPVPLGGSDGDGAFAVRIDERAPWQTLVVQASGKATARVPLPTHHRADEVPLACVLEDAAPLAGIVVDDQGRAVPGASLLIAHEWWSTPRSGARSATASDDRGAFVFAAAPLGRVVIRACAPGCAIAALVVDVPAAKPPRLVLHREVGERVQILGIPTPLPVEIAWRLTATPHWHGERPPGAQAPLLELPPLPPVQLGLDGSLQLPPFAGHTVSLAVASPWLLFDDRPGRSAFLAHVAAHCQQAVRVLDVDGAPWAFGVVHASDAQRAAPGVRLQTDGDGALLWSGAFSPYAKVAVAAAPASERLLVPVGQPWSRADARGALCTPVALPVLLQAVPAAAVSGRVLTEADGRPLAAAVVRLLDASGDVIAATTSRADGSWRIGGLGADGSELHVRADAGDVRAESAPFALTAAAELTVPPLQAAPLARIAGDLVDERARPIGGWRLLAWPWSDADRQATSAPLVVCTDRAGRFTFHLPAGSWRILPENDRGDWNWLSLPFAVDAGDVRDLTLVLDER